jgi:hypothetical protein
LFLPKRVKLEPNDGDGDEAGQARANDTEAVHGGEGVNKEDVESQYVDETAGCDTF